MATCMIEGCAAVDRAGVAAHLGVAYTTVNHWHRRRAHFGFPAGFSIDGLTDGGEWFWLDDIARPKRGDGRSAVGDRHPGAPSVVTGAICIVLTKAGPVIRVGKFERIVQYCLHRQARQRRPTPALPTGDRRLGHAQPFGEPE